jgi:MYXO-CTERM domain-containing protein
MRREIRTILATLAVALPVAMASIPNVASAGIITDLKTTRPGEVYESQTSQLFLNVKMLATGSSSGSNASSDEMAAGRPPAKPGGGPRHPGDPLLAVGPTEWMQIEQGLITEEEAISGCGGAQVAGGHAGWGAVALVGLFLALRRRR